MLITSQYIAHILVYLNTSHHISVYPRPTHLAISQTISVSNTQNVTNARHKKVPITSTSYTHCVCVCVAGRLLDYTHNYQYVFMLAGCEVVLSAIVLATCNFLFMRKKEPALPPAQERPPEEMEELNKALKEEHGEATGSGSASSSANSASTTGSSGSTSPAASPAPVATTTKAEVEAGPKEEEKGGVASTAPQVEPESAL